MLHPLWNWLRELKTEAPWYFWAYVALTPLGLLIRIQDSMLICSVAALIIYVFLLKNFGLLRSPSVYIFSLVAYCLMNSYIIEYFLGKPLYQYFTDIYRPLLYPDIYVFGILAACSTALATMFMLIYKRSFIYALKTGITTFFMLFPSIVGFILIVGPFFAY